MSRTPIGMETLRIRMRCCSNENFGRNLETDLDFHFSSEEGSASPGRLCFESNSTKPILNEFAGGW